MSSPSSANLSSREANRSCNDIHEPQLPQDGNPPEMDTVEDLRRKLCQAEKQNLELINQRNLEMSHYEKEVMKLRLELERGEALRRGLEHELSMVRKEAHMQMYSAEDELCDAKTKLVELQVLNDKHEQKLAETKKMFQSAQMQWEEEEQRFSRERDDIRRLYHTEMEFLIKEKTEAEKAFQELKAALKRLGRQLRELEAEHQGCSEVLRLQAGQLEFQAERQERLLRELQAATAITRKQEENTEAARAAHLECKYTSEIMQLRIQELEDALKTQKGSSTEALSVLENIKRDFRESENAHEREKNVLQKQASASNMQVKEVTEEKKVVEHRSGRLENTQTSFSQLVEEGPLEELQILLSLYQRLADGHVLVKPPEAAHGLSWTELCVLLHENVDALILNFHRATEKITQLEYICKSKTDNMKNIQQNQENAFEKMTEQLKAQEHCWQKEKKYLEQQYSSRLAEAHTRAQEYEETAQRNREKLYGLEKNCEKLTHENASVKNTLKTIQRERSSLLAACALLSGALCPLYSRLCAMSFQRDLLQDQANLHDLANQKIVSLIHALPAGEEKKQDDARLRQRRTTGLLYMFRRAVIAVLAASRLRALARSSCSLFIWTKGLKGDIGIRVCVGESRGRRNVSRFEEQGVDCVEALDWLTSSNLHSAIISSISELQDVLSKPDPNSWLSGHSLISAARNSFSKLMDKLSMMMEMDPLNPGRCIVYLDRDSLVQRLACGLHRISARALESGLYNRLPSTKNLGILQQQVFEFTRRLHTAEIECHSLQLQLSEFKWIFDEVKRDAEKAHRLQKQLHTVPHRMITQDNMHEELINALQREHEAKLLLHEQEQRLQELNNRLELHSSLDTDTSQDLNVSLTSLSEAMEELRRRDRVLNHQKRLLKFMEQDRRRLQESVQEAERALHTAARNRELIINHMKAVEATLHEVRAQAVMTSAAAGRREFCLQLPRVQLQIVSEEALRGRPEAIAFQAVLVSFMDVYQLAASRIETLVRETEAFQLRLAAQRSRSQTLRARERDGSTRESRHQRSSYRLESQIDQSNIPEFRPLPAEADISVGAIPRRNGTGHPQDRSSTAARYRSYTLSSAETPSRVTQDRTGTDPAMDTSSFVAPTITDSSVFYSPSSDPQNRTGTEPAMDTSTFVAPTITDSSVFYSRSGVTQDRTGTGSSNDISSHVMPNRTYTLPSTKTPSNVTQDRSGNDPAMDTSSFVAPTITDSSVFYSRSGVTQDRIGTGSSRDTSSFVIPTITDSSVFYSPSRDPQNRTETGSSMDISSHVMSNRTFTLSSAETPSNVTQDRSGNDPAMDTSSFVAPTITDSSVFYSPSSDPQNTTGTGSSRDTFSLLIPTLTDSSVFYSPSSDPQNRTGTGSSMDISSHVMPNRTFTLSSTKTPSNVTQDRTGTEPAMDTSSFVAPTITDSSVFYSCSSVTQDRTGTGSSRDTSSFKLPSITYTSVDTPASLLWYRTPPGSSVDRSSHLMSSRTFTLSSLSTPFSLTGNRAHTLFSVNIAPSFRRRRTSSPASVRPFSPDILSSTRRDEET